MAIRSGTYAKDADYTRRLIGYYHHEGVARSGSSLRASDEALESQDEGIHLRRAQRDLHHRFAEDAEDVQRGVEICPGTGGRRQDCAVRGHQAPGAGRDCRRSHQMRRLLHQPALAGGTSHQLDHGAEVGKRLKELDEMATDGRYELL